MRKRVRLVAVVVFVVSIGVMLAGCPKRPSNIPAQPPPPTPPQVAAGYEAGTNPLCPPTGTHRVNGVPEPYANITDAGLRNLAKRHVPSLANLATLTFADFAALQLEVDQQFGDASVVKTIFEPTRLALHDLQIPGRRISEGDYVQLVAHVVVARGEGPESVNCAGTDGRDIHVSLAPLSATEFDGIVAEMIPQLPRPPGWDPSTLNRLHRDNVEVRVLGGLSYDNEHLVNADPGHPKGGQPRRMSLWEIHPITAFFVCVRANTCDLMRESDWAPLGTSAQTDSR